MKLSRVPLFLSLLVCCARAAESPSKPVELALMSSVGNSRGLMYHVNFTVGTPGQLQTMIIDTGSSQTYVLASNASFCEAHGCDGSTFEPTKSSTFEKTNPGALEQTFMRNTMWFKGDYIRDVVQMSMQKSPKAKRLYMLYRASANMFSRGLGDLKNPTRTCQQTEARVQTVYRNHGPWLLERQNRIASNLR